MLSHIARFFSELIKIDLALSWIIPIRENYNTNDSTVIVAIFFQMIYRLCDTGNLTTRDNAITS